MIPLFKIHFCVVLFSTLTIYETVATTTCAESQKHFANLCFSPTPSLQVDPAWAEKNQPEDGWHLEIGNDVARLHFAEALRGELLTLEDKTLGNACLRSRLDHEILDDRFVADGTIYGYNGLTSKWYCNASRDFPGVLNCDVSSSGLSKYHEYLHTYVTYSDNKNLIVSIACFPNGQVGWTASSVSKTLTDEEKKTVNDHVKSLGFSSDDTVVLYDGAACSNDGK